VKRRTFVAIGPARLQRVVQVGLAISASEAKALVERGAVYVKGRRAKDAGVAVAGGDPVTVVVEEGGRPVPAAGPPPPLRVLFEDADVLAVDKAPGIPAQPTPGGEPVHLLGQVSGYLGAQAGLVHRLDRMTSGVTVFGKHPDATSALAAAFREGRAKKRYLAVVAEGALPSGTGRIDLPLARDPGRVGRWRALKGATGVAALTLYQRLYQGRGFCLVALYPQTGRTHQLRAHLRAVGAPIAGDALYEGPSVLGDLGAERCLLHAHALCLPHPRTGADWLVEAPLPADLEQFFRQAGVGPPVGAPSVEPALTEPGRP
jgi:23S rRNA pseudouridine1911/1915/1917 synthase